MKKQLDSAKFENQHTKNKMKKQFAYLERYVNLKLLYKRCKLEGFLKGVLALRATHDPPCWPKGRWLPSSPAFRKSVGNADRLEA